MKRVYALFDVPVGRMMEIVPKPGETVDALYKRRLRLARRYRAETGRNFRVEKQNGCVLWWRVDDGHHVKLADWYNLPIGHSFELVPGGTAADLKKVKATARYLYRKGAGSFEVRLTLHGVEIARLTGPTRT